MLTSIKSLYAKLCALLVSAAWVVYLGQSVFKPLLSFLPTSQRFNLNVAILLVIFLAWTRFLWPNLAHLSIKIVVNSSKVTIGIFLLTLALATILGTTVIPGAYIARTGDANPILYALYPLLGIPMFILLSIFGLPLVFPSSTRNLRNDA